MKIKQKILFCIAIPTLVAIFLCGQYIWVQFENRYISFYMQDNIVMVGAVADLITSLQKERGLSSVFVGSKGQNRPTLDMQRQQTDTLIPLLKQSLNQSHIPIEGIEKAKHSLEKLSDIRNEVFTATDATPILSKYTALIHDLMTLIHATIKDKTSFGLGKRMVNLVLLIEAQENAALLRGTLSGLLAADRPLPDAKKEAMMNLYASIFVNLKSPALILISKGQDIANELMESEHWKKMAAGFNVAMAKANEGHFGIQADQYFSIVTEVISNIIQIQTIEKDQLLNDIEKIKKASIQNIWITILIVVSVFLGMLIITVPIFKRIIVSINQTISAMKDIAEGEGNLTQRISIKTQDEIGELSTYFNNFIGKIQNIIRDISLHTEKLMSSSSELLNISNQLASAAEETDAQSGSVTLTSKQVSANVNTVASAVKEANAMVSNIAHMTEEMSATFQEIAKFSKEIVKNVESVASSSDEMSSNQTHISAAVEEMTASLNEVASNTLKSSRISREASKRADDINIRTETLLKASIQIGKVIGIIKNIASKTNMLALNATIEAAGAGEAGKGFAVVAGEVKELSKQSAEATDEIVEKIEEIQKSTEETVQAIKNIHQIISEIAQISETIAASVEEQSSTASEISKAIFENLQRINKVSLNAQESSQLVFQIARSIDESSKASQEVAKNIDQLANRVNEVSLSSSESAKGVENISTNIQMINNAAKETAQGAVKTNISSTELSKIAMKLTENIGRFKF